MSAMEEKPTRSRRSFTDGFKCDAAAMVHVDGKIVDVDVAERLGVGEGTLGNWVRQARVDRGERAGVSTTEREVLVGLRRENARLRMEPELLKRATGLRRCLSRDSDPLRVSLPGRPNDSRPQWHARSPGCSHTES